MAFRSTLSKSRMSASRRRLRRSSSLARCLSLIGFGFLPAGRFATDVE